MQEAAAEILNATTCKVCIVWFFNSKQLQMGVAFISIARGLRNSVHDEVKTLQLALTDHCVVVPALLPHSRSQGHNLR